MLSTRRCSTVPTRRLALLPLVRSLRRRTRRGHFSFACESCFDCSKKDGHLLPPLEQLCPAPSGRLLSGMSGEIEVKEGSMMKRTLTILLLMAMAAVSCYAQATQPTKVRSD